MKISAKKKRVKAKKGVLKNAKEAVPKRAISHIVPQCSIGQLKKSQGGNFKIDCSLRPISVRCWAHSRSGKRCSNMVRSREGEPIPIPYCAIHMKSGDGALKVVSHPFAGKCLVARYDLPAKYRMVFWGERGRCKASDKEDRAISYFPPDKVSGYNKDKDGVTKSDNYNGVLNPGDTGDILQYAACPGPDERQNMRSTFQYFGLRNGSIGGLEFMSLETVKKNTQLCHWYGPGWWSARDLKRCNVGTKRYPACLRIRKAKT